MTNEFLSKEIEEAERLNEEITIEKADKNLALFRAKQIRIERLKTLKECQEKHKRFVDKLKEVLWSNLEIENNGEFLTARGWIDKISSEDLE